MRSDERRRHVRIRPLPELPILVSQSHDPADAFAVYDVSIGGLGLVTTDKLRGRGRDEELSVTIDVGRYGRFDARIRVRYVGVTLAGTEIVEPAPALTTALGRYLAELLERGAFS